MGAGASASHAGPTLDRGPWGGCDRPALEGGSRETGLVVSPGRRGQIGRAGAGWRGPRDAPRSVQAAAVAADRAGGEATIEIELEVRGAAVRVAEQPVAAFGSASEAPHGCGSPDDRAVECARKHSMSFWSRCPGVMGHGSRSWLLGGAIGCARAGLVGPVRWPRERSALTCGPLSAISRYPASIGQEPEPVNSR